MKVRIKTALAEVAKNSCLRRSVSAIATTTANFVFAVVKAVTGIIYSSVFAISMAVYYLMLGALRAWLLCAQSVKKSEDNVYGCRCYNAAAWLLLLLNIPIGGAIFLLIRSNPVGSYPYYTIYASAAYTFYMMTVSIINLTRREKSVNMIFSALKMLNLVAAMIAVLCLQNALISTFSVENEAYRVTMNTVTGIAVYIFVIGIAVFMLFRSSKLRKEKDF